MWRYQFDGIRFPRKQEALGVLLLGLQNAERVGAEKKTWKTPIRHHLVGGWPTPLKNDGVRQLGWWHSQYMEKSGKIKNVPNHQPAINLDNVGKTIINHPPVITIFMGGICSIPKWVDKPPTSHLFLTSTPGSWLEKKHASLVPLNSDGFLGIDHDLGAIFAPWLRSEKNWSVGTPWNLGLNPAECPWFFATKVDHWPTRPTGPVGSIFHQPVNLSPTLGPQ